jgi:hypothetical protein
MKNLILWPLLLFNALSCFAQEQQAIKMSAKYAQDGDLVQLLQFQNIELTTVTFKGEDLKGKQYYIVSKEIWKGKIKATDTLINTKRINSKPIPADSLQFSVVAGKSAEKKLKIDFRFENMGLGREFKSTKSTDYSVRTVGVSSEIVTGTPFYAFAWILPYEEDGYKYWCEVEKNGKNIESWGSIYNIEHYILFEMNFF